jgi:light-regulated signal transduction histidine kinase (bacteriophytochrome)
MPLRASRLRLRRSRSERAVRRLIAAVPAVLRDLAEDIAARGADVSRGPLPTVVAGDPGELHTLMAHLVGHAPRPAPGAAPRVHVDADADGRTALLVTLPDREAR